MNRPIISMTVLLVLVGLTGCPSRHRAKSPTTQVTHADSLAAATADSAERVANSATQDSVDTEAAAGTKLTKEPLPPSGENGAGSGANEPGIEAVKEDTASAPPRLVLVPQLSESEKQSLRDEAERERSLTLEHLAEVNGAKLSAEDKETVATTHSLLDQSRHAEEASDYRLAANLARKARLLSEELASRNP